MSNKCLICEKIELFNEKAKDFIIETADGYIFYVRPHSLIYFSKKGVLKKLGRIFYSREWTQQYGLPNDKELYLKILFAWESAFHISAIWTHVGSVLSNNCRHALFYYFSHDERTESNLFLVFNSLSKLRTTQKDRDNISKFREVLEKGRTKMKKYRRKG